jgi:alpha-galactosidase
MTIETPLVRQVIQRDRSDRRPSRSTTTLFRAVGSPPIASAVRVEAEDPLEEARGPDLRRWRLSLDSSVHRENRCAGWHRRTSLGPWLAVALQLPSAGGGPTAAELARRDRWVADHFAAAAAPTPAAAASAALPPGLTVWSCYGPAFTDRLPNRPLQIAGRRFERGLYVHAPSRVGVTLPGRARTLRAIVGIEDSESVGGSVVFAVEAGEQRLFATPVVRRGEEGRALAVELHGATSFTLVTSSAGDGISSDQSAWGDAQVELEDGSTLALGSLPLRDALALPRAASPLPFSFRVDGRTSDELLALWKSDERVDASQPDRTTRTRTWRDPASGLSVEWERVEWTGFPTVEWIVRIVNGSRADSPMIAGLLPLDATFTRGERGEFLLHHFVGSPCAPNDYEPLEATLAPGSEQRIATSGGRPTNSDLPYFDVETGDGGGFIAAIGWPGQWSSRFARDEGCALRIAGGQEAACFRLHPGESARSARIVLQFFEGDWHHAQNVWRRWMVAHNVPRLDGRVPEPFTYVCTGNFYPGLKTEAASEIAFLEGFVKRGIVADYWDQDAGWYPCGDGWWNVGTWEVDRTRWPKGVREASDWLHAHGMKSILWFEPERVAAGSWLAQNHPDWIHGGAGGGLLRLDLPEARAWITDRVDALLTSEAIDFYRQDFNIDPLYYWRGADADDRIGLTEMHHVEAYLSYWDELLRRHPALRIDSCASGGRRNDLETLRRAVPILRSDWVPDPANPATDPMDQQNHIYGISFWMPFHGSGFGTLDRYWARSTYGPIFGIGADTRRTDLDDALMRELFLQGRAIQPDFLGDYWPLTPYSRSLEAWCAWQFDRPDLGTGHVAGFRRKSCASASLAVRLRGLDPAARYELLDVDSHAQRVVTGRELMTNGIVLEAAAQPAAPLITYRRVE